MPDSPAPPALPDTLLKALDARYRPLSGRRRLLILLLAIATAVTIFWLLLYRPGGVKATRVRVLPAVCAPGQTTGCIGGQSDVIVLPPQVAASAAPASGGHPNPSAPAPIRSR